MQLVIKTSLLRELDEYKLVEAYAHLVYVDSADVENDIKIKDNLIKILDWDINGDNGFALYCSKFEDLKRKDWKKLISLIKINKDDIIRLSKNKSQQALQNIKEMHSYLENEEAKKIKRYSNINYTVSGRGKKAKTCTYNGTTYKSRIECMYKEHLSKAQLYKYLRETNQV